MSTPWAIALLVVALSGCAAPLRVQRVAPDSFYREQVANVLSSKDVSDATHTVLRRHDLLPTYRADTDAAIESLRESLRGGSGGGDELFAMAELALFHAKKTDDTRYYLAAAIYAYAFLFPHDPDEAVHGGFDPRTRVASDLYSRALAQALRDESDSFLPRSGTLALPHGSVEIHFDPAGLDWHGYRLSHFMPVGELRVTGLRNRYRQPGLGAPLAAHPLPPGGNYRDDDLVGANIRVPVTAVLALDKPREQLAGTGTLQASLALHATSDEESIEIGEQLVPLEAEPSVVLAKTLVATQLWDIELAAFLGDALSLKLRPTLLRALQPYQRGKIPVVFVHGTASSPFRWADMVNDLHSDPAIRQRYQFWFFTYDSGNPIAYSAYHLRRLLSAQVARLDPEGADPALRRMVVIGHSQGGLLTKMTAIHSGDRFWRNISNEPFEKADLSPKVRELVRDGLFIEPLPFVERVIFISTPHRGSYLAGPQLVRRLAQRLVRLPGDVIGAGTELTGLTSRGDTVMSMQTVPTAIDNMSPGHPFIKALAEIPIDQRIKAYSIIPVKQAGDFLDGDDGVVKYRSAHIEGVESELIVHDAHSTQANPHTVEEVRRILHLQLAGE